MIEVHEVRKVMDLDPTNRYLPLHSLFQLFNFDRLFLHDVMAIHAHACRWDSRMPAGTRSIVTIKTGNLVIAGMNFVGKVDRLFG